MGGRGTRRCWLPAGTARHATSSPLSSLQISTSARRWAALSPCAGVAPARTRRAPTAATAHRATWPWPGPTTVCPRQPRAPQQRSSRGAGVRVLPSGVQLWHSGPGSTKAPRGCRCFEALRSFPSKAHNFPATSLYRPGLSSQPLHPPPPCQPLLLPQQSPPRTPAPVASPCATEAYGTPSPATQPQPSPPLPC